MSEVAERIKEFVQYAGMLAGDEKGEAQVFCDRLFRGFGHGGYKEAGATLEYRVKNDSGGTSFADLIWKPRVLIEMKKRGAELQLHYQQAFESGYTPFQIDPDTWSSAISMSSGFMILTDNSTSQ